MATQILRTIDRWRFEVPLALALAAASGFAAMAMPHDLFGRVPIVGTMGTPGRIGLALSLAIVCGGLGYLAMRRPRRVAAAEEVVDPVDDGDAPSGVTAERLVRLRRADRHPDAPPRAPIRASRDLGEPFMEDGTPVPEPAETDAQMSDHVAEAPIPDGDYVEIAAVDEAPTADPAVEPAAEPSEPVAIMAADAAVPADPELDPASASASEPAAAPLDADSAAEPVVAETPVAIPSAPAARVANTDSSLAGMMERLSSGMARRAATADAAPARDMRPALRDALDELNRLAARRG